MSRRTDEDALLARAREALQGDDLPGHIQSRLRQARADAVASTAASAGTRAGNSLWLVPAGALGAVALAAVLLRNAPANHPPLLDEQEMAAAMEMDVLEEMEFLAWMLETEPDAG